MSVNTVSWHASSVVGAPVVVRTPVVVGSSVVVGAPIVVGTPVVVGATVVVPVGVEPPVTGRVGVITGNVVATRTVKSKNTKTFKTIANVQLVQLLTQSSRFSPSLVDITTAIYLFICLDRVLHQVFVNTPPWPASWL